MFGFEQLVPRIDPGHADYFHDMDYNLVEG
jgi:hypothetical protein